MIGIGSTLVWSLLVAQAAGSGDPLPQREKPEEYQAKLGLVANRVLAADYLARSAPTVRGVIFTPDHLVVEIAFFGPGSLDIQTSHFQLQIEGGRGTPKAPVRPEPSTAVAGSLREGSIYDVNRPNLEASGSVNNSGVILGRKRPSTGIPDIDARQPGRGPGPPATGAPGHDRSGIPPEERFDPAEALAQVEWASGERKLPARGLLYFPYSGKLKALRRVTLLYRPNPDGDVLPLLLLP